MRGTARLALGAAEVDAVTALVREVGREILLPRFTRLAPSDIASKGTAADPDDVVTVADRLAEARLTDALEALVPGAVVVGEEAVHGDRSILGRMDAPGPVWLVDPLDGTRNFVAGLDRFGILVAYAVDGVTLAAWIHLPVSGDTFVAESGGGAWLNDSRIRVPAEGAGRTPRGAVHTRYMPRALRERAMAQAARLAAPAPDTSSAAVEYADVLRGGRDFAVYYRLLPWDHAGPALIVSEGGGVCVHADGASYGPRSKDQVMVVAASTATADAVRGWFAEPGGETEVS